jgi:hypothetical protein
MAEQQNPNITNIGVAWKDTETITDIYLHEQKEIIKTDGDKRLQGYKNIIINALESLALGLEP